MFFPVYSPLMDIYYGINLCNAGVTFAVVYKSLVSYLLAYGSQRKYSNPVYSAYRQSLMRYNSSQLNFPNSNELIVSKLTTLRTKKIFENLRNRRTMAPNTDTVVALIGRLGHGKSQLVNKVCGTHHVSTGGCRSATRDVEYGYSKKHKITLFGTPGLGPTEEVAKHIAAQKLALEYTPLSAIYIVVKCGRDGDMICDQICDIIDMVGEAAVRIIVTHADVEATKTGYDEEDVKQSVSRLADIPTNLIKVVGKDTSGAEIEDFIYSTLLPTPVSIKLDLQGAVRLAASSKQSRRLSKSIRDIHGKLEAATKYCDDTVAKMSAGYDKDVEIVNLQRGVTEMVDAGKQSVFRDASSLGSDEQSICYAQAGMPLAVKLKGFIEKSNKLLSWKVTDTSDPRNHYKACPHCGAVWVKVEGCNGATTCGSVPTSRDNKRKKGDDDDEWLVKTFYAWVRTGTNFIMNRTTTQSSARYAAKTEKKKLEGAVFESGCGKTIIWSSMHPIEPSLVAALGKVEQQKEAPLESFSHRRFEADIGLHEELHKQDLESKDP